MVFGLDVSFLEDLSRLVGVLNTVKKCVLVQSWLRSNALTTVLLAKMSSFLCTEVVILDSRQEFLQKDVSSRKREGGVGGELF